MNAVGIELLVSSGQRRAFFCEPVNPEVVLEL